MKWVLVNKFDEIVDTCEVPAGAGVGELGIRNYFKQNKQMENDEDFDNLWRVMSKDKYDNLFKTTLQNRQMGTRKYEWWKDEESYMDIEAPITKSGEPNE